MRNEQANPLNSKTTLPVFWKKTLSALVIILLLLVALAVLVNQRWKPYLTAQVKEAIITSTDSLYSISFENVSVNILTGSATFKKVVFAPNAEVYQKMVDKKAAPKHLFTIEVASLNFRRIHPFKVYFQRKLEMESLIIKKPRVIMTFRKLSQPQNTIVDNRTAYQRLSKYLSSIKVNEITFQDADFQYIDRGDKRSRLTRLQHLDINISGLLIDSASRLDSSKLYHTDNISLRLRNYNFRSPNGMYDLKIKEFNISTRSKSAKVTGLRLIPRYSEMQFTEMMKTRTERFSLRFDLIGLEGIDFKAFNDDRVLIASKLSVANSNSNIFVNKTLPKQVKDRTLSFPQIALRNFNLETRIDSVSILNARISYAEYSKNTKRRGQIFFDHIDGLITNMTNDSVSLTRNAQSKAGLSGLIMGRGRFDTELDFNLVDPSAPFKWTARVGNMNASLLNPILRPLALIEVRKGFIEEVKLVLSGNIHHAQGTLSAKYDNLKISILSNKESDTRLKKMGIASMAANVMILKSENPSPGESLRKSAIYYSRPDTSGFISMNLKGVVAGFKETIGLDPKTERRIKNKLLEMKTVKAEREQRREERLKRREKRQNNRK